MTPQEQKLVDEIAALRAECARLAQARQQKLTLKVAEKGGISIYGMGRFPVTLYPEQWAQIATLMPTIVKFAADHADELAANGQRAKAAGAVAAA